MKRLNVKDVGRARVVLIFFPEHDSALGHFKDSWQVRKFLPGEDFGNGCGTRKAKRPRNFKTFVSAATYFNKVVAELEAGK